MNTCKSSRTEFSLTDNVATQLRFLLPDELTPIRSDLATHGDFQRSEDDCPFCTDGTLWKSSHRLICDTCSGVIDKDTTQRSSSRKNKWEYFAENRPRYQSGTRKCVGGFKHVYDWVSENDTDPDNFYK